MASRSSTIVPKRISKKIEQSSHISRSFPSLRTSSKHELPKGSLSGARFIKPMFNDSFNTTTGVPIALQSVTNRQFQIHGDFNKSLRINGLQPLFNTCLPPTGSHPIGTSTIPGIEITGTYTGSSVSQIYPYVVGLNPLRMPVYGVPGASTWSTGVSLATGHTLPNQALSWSQFRWHRLVLHFYPTYATNTPNNHTLAYSRDPSHPAIGLTQNPLANYPSEDILLACSNSFTFNPWSAWSMELPVDNTQKYMYFPPQYASGGTAIWPDNDMRFGCSGCITMLSNNDSNSSGAPVFTGTMYMEFDVELLDPAPYTYSFLVAQMALFHDQPDRLKDMFKAIEQKEERPGGPDDDDDDDPGDDYKAISAVAATPSRRVKDTIVASSRVTLDPQTPVPVTTGTVSGLPSLYSKR